VSFTPSTTNVNTSPVVGGNGAETTVLEAALSFETTMGTSSVKADIAAESAGDKTRKYRAGLLVGVGGITVGGSVSRQIDSDSLNADLATSRKRRAYDLGVSYAMGDYKFGIATAVGVNDVGTSLEDTEKKWSIGMQYAIDTGVTGTLTLIRAEYKDGNTGGVTDNNDGEAIIGQIKVSF